MPWFKVDDGFWSHPKVLELPTQSLALWVRAGSYCAHQLTDGEIKPAILRTLGHDPVDAEVLVSAGLWDIAGESWVFHDWAKYQPTRAVVLAEREKAAERQRKSRESRAGIVDSHTTSHAVTTTVTAPVSHTTPTRPDPSLNYFDEFWDVWPKRVARADAVKAWVKAVKKAEPVDIISAARGLAESPYRPERQFIPNPATWLNGERWNDPEPEAPAKRDSEAWMNA